jgi:hydroxymethylpyrimidine pyrophosphatase-like HAD family hydrolase
MIPLNLSDLGHTWFIDLDGTIVEHNGYLSGEDRLLDGVKEFWNEIPSEDYIVITTGRSEESRETTLDFLNKNSLRFNHAIFGLPLGERIIMNDIKPGGLKTAIAWNLERNKGLK